MKRPVQQSRVLRLNGVLIAAVLAYVVVRASLGSGLRLGHAVPTEVSDVLLFAVLSGLLSYGSLESLKRLTRIRAWVHSQAAVAVLGGAAWTELNARLGDGVKVDSGLVWRYGGSAAAFDLPSDQLAAQVSVAADAALADLRMVGLTNSGLDLEEVTPHLLKLSPLTAALASSAWSFSNRRERGQREHGQPSSDDPYEAQQSVGSRVHLADHAEMAFEVPQQPEPITPAEQEDELEFELARAVRTGTDQLQIALTEQWRRTVQGAAVWAAGVWGIGVVQVAHIASSFGPTYVLAGLLVGGPLAWTFRDAAAALERSRT